MQKFLKEADVFLDLKVSVFHNKKNGQISLALPKRELKKIIELKDSNNKDNTIPKKIPIRIFKWGS